MADKISKRRNSKLKRSDSTETIDSPMGRSIRERKHKKPKERWLLTRKTWRYMTDAGRKLIPDGAQNRMEDIPKIEAYFQEVCKKEPKFLLWRKNSYPGAIAFRKKKKEWRKGGSCRKATSADEVDDVKPQRPKDLPLYPSTSGGRFDIQKLKYDFLNKTPSPTGPSPRSFLKNKETFPNQSNQSGNQYCQDQYNQSGQSNKYNQRGKDGKGSQTNLDALAVPERQQQEIVEEGERQLMNMLEEYLSIDKPSTSNVSPNRGKSLNHQELIDKLQRHLTLVSRNIPTQSSPTPARRAGVKFEGDIVQKSLTETLSRYFSQYPNRDRVISDLLTDRKALEKLYFELRKTKGFSHNRGGTGYTKGNLQWSPSLLRKFNNDNTDSGKNVKVAPPKIQIQPEKQEPKYRNGGTQTSRISEETLQKAEEEYKKLLAEREEETKWDLKHNRRRSSVDNDDVSQSVSDTIKRYLRMARKKSVDQNQADRFKRVNYDRNLRNIKAKGEITKPGDDDGLNKGCQTNDDWMLKYRDLQFDECSEPDSHVSSCRSSFDAGVVEEHNRSSPTSPSFMSSGQSFLSHLLHSKQSHDKNAGSAAVSAGAAMQKSKSSSSVMHHGSRLMAKKIFSRSRSKSQTRVAAPPSIWTPQKPCVWSSVTGKQVVLTDTNLMHLTEVEKKVLQKVALAKLQALNLGVTIKVPPESVGSVVGKTKRRPYLLKRKALTTGIFDSGSRKEGEKEKDTSTSGGLVFGIPLSQCVENDRISRLSSGASPFRSRVELSATGDEPSMGRHGSRASFSSLIEGPRGDESGSCESLLARERMVGSVPGLLDTLSCGSTADIPVGVSSVEPEGPSVPNILNLCIKHLETHGLHTLGIFRVSTSKKRIRQLREDFDCGKESTIEDEQCPHDVATLLKEFLRDLPDPLLCRDLYHAFVQTQRIRNRRLQLEALQHLIQLLPTVNRDTLWTLLNFLVNVAKHANDATDATGEEVQGNKMDSTNLATVFAPNILHCVKLGSSKDAASDRPEDRLDVINVIRILIDNNKALFTIPAELLDEVYVHMMDSHPEILDQLLCKREAMAPADESQDDLDSESNSTTWTPPATSVPSDQPLHNFKTETDGRDTPPEPKRTWSREEFLHESAATGGPNVAMKIRHKDKIRERNSKKRRDESSSMKKKGDDVQSPSAISSAMTIISRLVDSHQYSKTRSSSLESNASVHHDTSEISNRLSKVSHDSQGIDRRKSTPYILDNSGIITASLTIPVQSTNQGLSSYNVEDDIPYIEDVSGYGDSGKQQMTIGLVRTPTAPPRRRQRSISGSDSSVASTVQAIQVIQQGYDSAMGSSVTYSSPPPNTTPSSITSSIADAGMLSSPPSWASSPPTSPDSVHTSVNYIPDDVSTTTSPKITTTQSKTSVQKISLGKEAPILQKVSFTSTTEVQQVRRRDMYYQQVSRGPSSEVHKSPSTPAFSAGEAGRPQERVRDKSSTPSITSIGNAVLRSKTQDFERIAKTESKTKTTTTSTVSTEKKKYTKRRYTDSRHPTQHIPDSGALEASSSSAPVKKEERTIVTQAPVYKRRELISSVPSK